MTVEAFYDMDFFEMIQWVFSADQGVYGFGLAILLMAVGASCVYSLYILGELIFRFCCKAKEK